MPRPVTPLILSSNTAAVKQFCRRSVTAVEQYNLICIAADAAR